MIAIKKILFPTDFSDCANQALCHATYLAQKFESELIMLHTIVMYEDDPNNPDQRFPDLLECYESMEEVAITRMEKSVDEETRDKIFHSFFSTKGSRGTGLVLMLAKKSVDEHEGVIEVESEKGKGTKFFIRLPEKER